MVYTATTAANRTAAQLFLSTAVLFFLLAAALPAGAAAPAPVDAAPVDAADIFGARIDPPSARLFAARPVPAGAGGRPGSILVVGDSFAVGVGMLLAPTLKKKGIKLAARGKTSSGLNSPRFYNWEKALARFLKNDRPDALVVMIGGNDANNGDGSAKWTENYRKKASRFLNLAEKADVPVCWVALPPMKNKTFDKKVRAANRAGRRACMETGGCGYVEADKLFGDAAGRYVRKKTLHGKTVSLRAKDGVHLTTAGYRLVCDAVMKHVSDEKQVSLKE